MRTHPGLNLDSKLSFNKHINDKVHQANKGIYELFVRPLLNYAGEIYDRPSNALFSKKKLTQFNIMWH